MISLHFSFEYRAFFGIFMYSFAENIFTLKNKVLYGCLILCLVVGLDIYAQQRRDTPVGGQNTTNPNAPFNDVNRPQSPFDDSNSRIKTDDSGRAIQDDSTKQVYGAFTTRFYHERDCFENTLHTQNPDTTLLHFHRYNAVAKSGYLLQDLGNVGTAAVPVYVSPATEMGNTSGFYAYNPYIYTIDRIRYYNTKSPFSTWDYVQGGNSRSLLDVGYTRNIGQYVNISALYHRIDAPLLVANDRISNNDKQVRHQTFLFSFNAQTKDTRYKVMANASKYFHNTIETGGVFTDNLPNLYTPFMQNNRGIINRLYNATGEEYSEKWRLYHEFEILPQSNVRVFHRFRRVAQRNAFSNDLTRAAGSIFSSGTDITFHRNIFLNRQFTYHKFIYQFYENQQGIKYQKDSQYFLALWHRHRSYVAAQEYMTYSRNLYDLIPFQIPDEQYIGALGRLYYDSSTYLRIEAEQIIKGNYPQQHKIEMSAHHAWGEIGVNSYHTTPSLLATYYFGNHFRWNNTDFSSVLSQQFYTKVHFKRKKWSVSPFLQVNRLKGYIYWDTLAIPKQVNQVIGYTLAGLNTHLQIGNIHQHVDFYQLLQTDTRYLRMPRTLVNYQVYFQNYLFKKATLSQIGLDFHYHTAFYKQAYMPVTQQFHLQDIRAYGNYLIAEFFINFIIKNTRVFIKLPNLLQKVAFNTSGYYVTPDYAGQSRELEFGLSWYFYD